MKIEIGDTVIVTKSNNLNDYTYPGWVEEMDEFDGTVQEVSNIIKVNPFGEDVILYELVDGQGYTFREEWLTKVEES